LHGGVQGGIVREAEIEAKPDNRSHVSNYERRAASAKLNMRPEAEHVERNSDPRKPGKEPE
jgi:hypothetical protein